ncbi:putative membrane protein [Asticcacaulis biprosthecium C19]|uniref:Putative membrane protein n=1 Tax=Asticcacaulis biprosthecium C19 TaxID=715226 RepID=F4QG74_9CAUL|nr:DUF4328 domain-containing protein [Asticcacaulis biprosthecium]EGF92402.1 putative membrane protein [Asticcacaulis biprosthecium C19]
MANKTTFKTGRGQAIALHVLAVPDVALGILGLTAAMASGWPAQIFRTAENTSALGLVFLVAMAQLIVRLPMLAVIMRWTWRLVSNAEKQGRLAVSARWAWVGYVVPVAAFWLPAHAVWTLNTRHSPLAAWQRVLIVAWWVSRLLSCTTGAFLILIVLMVQAAIAAGGYIDEDTSTTYGMTWIATLFIVGLVTRVLEAAVITLTHLRQPKPGEVVAAKVF